MIGESGVSSVVTKVSQTNWDLSSSITGTVKRRPSSLNSCKSNSPTAIESSISIDFPIDSPNEVVSASCKINKLRGGDDLSQEIEKGNVKDRKKARVEKIDTLSIKKRILKLPESARKSFTSKLKLPNSLTSTAGGNKLSLSQLEQKNNLFIRDGQMAAENNNCESKINKKIAEMAKSNQQGRLNFDAIVESTINPKHQHEAPTKGKKSLIPSFLSTTKNANQMKTPSTSKAHQNFVSKTGNKFKELCRDASSPGRLKKQPPPYRPPPLPPTQSIPSTSKAKRNRLSRNLDGENGENTVHTQAIVHAENMEKNDDDAEVDIMLVKAEYSPNVFKNIPVRPRKGNVSHMDNYCLFDPSVDFCNEKDLMKKPNGRIPIGMPFAVDDEKIEDVTFDDKTLYDITEHDERIAHHNYYEIDPELLEQEEKTVVIDEKCKKKSKNYTNSLSSSSESSNSSTTTTSSSDYPSLFNSVIETTHSSTVESTDENDSNDYGKTIETNQPNVSSNESIITVQNATNASTGTKKKSPQVDRIIRSSRAQQTSNSKPSIIAVKMKSTTKSREVHLDPLKQSHSLPHLQNVTSRCRQQVGTNRNEFNFVIDNTTTIQMRRTHSSRQGRPLSTHSDDRDSGFLSPVTPPDCQNGQSSCAIGKSDAVGEGRTKTESTLLNQCDNIQQLIEVSF